MIETVIRVRLSGALLQEASQDADRTGMSLENWLVSLAAERMRDKQVTERFFSRTPQPTDGQRMLEILDSTNDNPPLPGDEFES